MAGANDPAFGLARTRSFLRELPPDQTAAQLLCLLVRFAPESEAQTELGKQGKSARVERAAGVVRSLLSERPVWATTLLAGMLADRRPLVRSEVRVCDAAADAMAKIDRRLPFVWKQSLKERDLQIAQLRKAWESNGAQAAIKDRRSRR